MPEKYLRTLVRVPTGQGKPCNLKIEAKKSGENQEFEHFFMSSGKSQNFYKLLILK